MGSGENWWAITSLPTSHCTSGSAKKQRPVPSFLIFDQPSQAHYPPERDAEGSINALKDEDKAAVLQLFKLISTAAQELAPAYRSL